MGHYVKISGRGLTGWMREDIYHSLPSFFFEDPVSSIRKMKGDVIKESKWRWAAIFSLPDGKRVFLKKDRTKGLAEKVKYLLFPSKGRKEWIIAYQLLNRNLNIPNPIGWMEKVRRGFVEESYYLSEAIGSGVSLIDDDTRLKEPASILELARTIRKIQEAGLYHRDLHAGNFLWEGNLLFLTDLHDTRILKGLSLNQRLWNLSHLFHSLRSAWGKEEQIQFAENFFEKHSIPSQETEKLLERIHSGMHRLQRRQWRSRSKRCLKESTEFSVRKERGFSYYHRRDFPLERVKSVAERHRRIVESSPSSLLKNAPEVSVALFRDGKEALCIKQFRYPNNWKRLKDSFRQSKGLKGWMGGNGLRSRGVPSVKPMALVEEKGLFGMKESLFIMEALETGLEMDRFILQGFENFKKKRSFCRCFARWLSSIHRMNLYHKDMKTCNIFIQRKGEAWEFYFLDLEDVLLDRRSNESDLFRNLVQLNTSTPKVMARSDRFRFFKEYVRLNPIISNQKSFLRQLIEESRRRGLVYVSPQGVVMEDFR